MASRDREKQKQTEQKVVRFIGALRKKEWDLEGWKARTTRKRLDLKMKRDGRKLAEKLMHERRIEMEFDSW